MAKYAQYLYVFRVCTQSGLRAVRFYMVALKLMGTSAICAFTTFCNNILNKFADYVRTFTTTTVPIWMCRRAPFCSTGNSSTGRRTILSFPPVTFTYTEIFATVFTNAVNKYSWLAGFNLSGAGSGAGVSMPSDMGMRASKLPTACSTNESNMPSTDNFSFGGSHG